MGLRIASNVSAEVIQKNLEHQQAKATKEMEKLSSGKRINRAADDAAGLAAATNLEAHVRGLQQATRNANDGISFIQTAEGGLNEIGSILVRLRELTIQSASDTVGDNERGLLDKEYQELIKEINRISEATTFNGTNVINGHGKGVLRFHVGAFAGEVNEISFDSDSANTSSDNIGVTDTSVITKDSALSTIEHIDEAINRVSIKRAEMGAIQSRLQSTVQNLDTQRINHEHAASVIRDTDVAESSAKLAVAQIGISAAISTLAQANTLPFAATRLLDKG